MAIIGGSLNRYSISSQKHSWSRLETILVSLDLTSRTKETTTRSYLGRTYLLVRSSSEYVERSLRHGSDGRKGPISASASKYITRQYCYQLGEMPSQAAASVLLPTQRPRQISYRQLSAPLKRLEQLAGLLVQHRSTASTWISSLVSPM